MIICGDALTELRKLPDESVHCCVTDPPYGIGFIYSDGKEKANNPEDYWNWLRPIYGEMIRILKSGGFFAIWQTQLNYRHFWDWFGDDIHIYVACKNFVQIRKTPINYAYDPVVMKYKSGAPPLRPLNPPRSLDFYVANTAGIVSDKNRLEKAHPCPRPLDAVREILINFTLPSGLILDPFFGAGTVGVVAKQLGRDFIGIELNQKYCELAERRIAQVGYQMEMIA